MAAAHRRVQRGFVTVGGDDGGHALGGEFAEGRVGMAWEQHQSDELHVASERTETGTARIGARIVTTRTSWDFQSSFLESFLSAYRAGERRRRSLASAATTTRRSKAAISHS